MKKLLVSLVLIVAAAMASWSVPPYNLVVSGGVTAVRAGYGLTFSESPLTDTGTIIWDSTGFKAWYNAGTTGDSMTKLVYKGTRVRAATIYTTNIFPTAATTHLLFALTASTSLDSVRFKATVVRGDSSDWVAVSATNLRGRLTGTADSASGAVRVGSLDTTTLKSHTLAGKAATAGTADSSAGGAVRVGGKDTTALKSFVLLGKAATAGTSDSAVDAAAVGTLDTTALKAHTLAGKAATAGTADSGSVARTRPRWPYSHAVTPSPPP
jgi:hypothetical protein